MDQNIAVIGAGITGLAAGLATAEAGSPTRIFGISPNHIKGGVQLAPNAWLALKTLGVDTDIMAQATRLNDAADIRGLRGASYRESPAFLGKIQTGIFFRNRRNARVWIAPVY